MRASEERNGNRAKGEEGGRRQWKEWAEWTKSRCVTLVRCLCVVAEREWNGAKTRKTGGDDGKEWDRTGKKTAVSPWCGACVWWRAGWRAGRLRSAADVRHVRIPEGDKAEVLSFSCLLMLIRLRGTIDSAMRMQSIPTTQPQAGAVTGAREPITSSHRP